MMETKVRYKSIHGLPFGFRSDYEKGELLDTEVTLDTKPFCWIEGNKIDDFIGDLECFLNKYAI